MDLTPLLKVCMIFSQAFNPLDKQTYSSARVRCEVGGTVVECNVTPLQDEEVYAAEVTSKLFQEVASDAKLLHLEDELQSCRELNELEPGNKCELNMFMNTPVLEISSLLLSVGYMI